MRHYRLRRQVIGQSVDVSNGSPQSLKRRTANLSVVLWMLTNGKDAIHLARVEGVVAVDKNLGAPQLNSFQ